MLGEIHTFETVPDFLAKCCIKLENTILCVKRGVSSDLTQVISDSSRFHQTFHTKHTALRIITQGHIKKREAGCVDCAKELPRGRRTRHLRVLSGRFVLDTD